MTKFFKIFNGKPSILTKFMVYFSFSIFFIFGYVEHHIEKIIAFFTRRQTNRNSELLTEFENFWRKHLYIRTADRFGLPIASCPSTWVDVYDQTIDERTRTVTSEKFSERKLNLASYNYLGFGDKNGENVSKSQQILQEYGSSHNFPRSLIVPKMVLELENEIAKFLNKEAAFVCGQGFTTNSGVIGWLVDKNDVIISDSLNHASIVTGCRRSNCKKILKFQHNNFTHLEELIRNTILFEENVERILIIVEGIYSMEGDICQLDKIIHLKKKYNCLLFIDEAHSIGVVGENGKGVGEYYDCLDDVDICMGTFTKSFGAVGGYIAGDKGVIDHLKKYCEASNEATCMSPVCAAMALYSLQEIINPLKGKQKIQQIIENAHYFRNELEKMGFHIIGDQDSPVVPLMLYYPAKIPGFARECMKRGLAVVVVAYPATPVVLGRVRFCLSSNHTKEDLDFAINVIDEVGNITCTKYNN
eukprot:TRINITY_DN2857_c0_g1_i3.p1 TRINITY_DN2857_c0_g1~~TRINITY_DN2857_c0_g1_i3.p1  ORF type:complete len:473 (-),score=96.02 TRINITY_DN2857_c0_g1_i3:655-2073(-)